MSDKKFATLDELAKITKIYFFDAINLLHFLCVKLTWIKVRTKKYRVQASVSFRNRISLKHILSVDT